MTQPFRLLRIVPGVIPQASVLIAPLATTLATVSAALLLSATAAGAEPLKAGLQESQASLARMRDVSQDVKSIERAVDGLYKESTRQLVATDLSHNIIAGANVNIPFSYKCGQYLPPRQEWVERYVADIGPTLSLLKKGVDEMEQGRQTVMVPATIKDEFQELFVQWSELVKGANQHYDKLKAYTAEAKLTNKQLGNYALELSRDVRALDLTIKDSYKLVKDAQKKNNKSGERVPIAFHFVNTAM